MAKLTWYGAKGPPDEVYRRIVRGVPGVGEAVYAKTVEIAAKAEARLTPHNLNSDKTREPGESRSHITTDRGDIVDGFVNLEDADGGALAIEWDLAILRGAALS